MAIFKCKICGGTLEINVGETVATCEYCGTKQTLPKLDDEKKANLFERANHFRRNNDFDKAMSIYEQILNEDMEDAESYWSIVLCRYGIEYVEDPSTHKRVPTVNRAQFTSVFDDEDYRSAIKYADNYQKDLYEQEARTINEIQKGILAISGQEEPFDVFICYKESDNSSRRTPDSVLATELYYELTKEGFKVFFSRITLEDKLGTAYEPYIFAALHSAKVMVALGTKPEHFNAVWVKNEWSRYLALIKNGANKILIPAYRDMDSYDLPEEFSHLQAQDMSKLGFMQDLVRGIKKLVEPKAEYSQRKERNTQKFFQDINISPLLDKAYLLLEDKKWGNAKKLFSQIIDIEPKNAKAYLGLLMVRLRINKTEDLIYSKRLFNNNANYLKAVRFAENSLKSQLENITNEHLYSYASRKINGKKMLSPKEYTQIAEQIQTLECSETSTALIAECIEKANISKESRRKKIKAIITTAIIAVMIAIIAIVVAKYYIIPNSKYNAAVTLYNEERYEEAEGIFKEIPQYKDSTEFRDKCVKALVKASNVVEFFHNIDKKISYEEFVSLYGSPTKTEIRYGREKIYPPGTDTSKLSLLESLRLVKLGTEKVRIVYFWGAEKIPYKDLTLLGQTSFLAGQFGGWFEPMVDEPKDAKLSYIYCNLDKTISKPLFDDLVSYISNYEGEVNDISYSEDIYEAKWEADKYEYKLLYKVKGKVYGRDELQYSKSLK